MSKHEDKQSLRHEPHLSPDHRELDPSEEKAEQRLGEVRPRDDRTYRTGQSVFDEPDILPGRVGEVIDRDWSCSKCGYNLRGLPLERGCPECGHRELYRPPPPGAESYQSWLRRKQAQAAPRTGWVVAIVAAAVGGPLAILAALMGTDPGGLMGRSIPILAIVFGPVVEETMKIAAAFYVVETRPHLFSRSAQIQLAAVGSALIFAAIENVFYLEWYIPNPSDWVIVWRWTACVALHVGCTLLVAHGVVDVWRRAVTEYRPPRVSQALPMLTAAILLHACFNAGVLGWEWSRGPIR